MALSIARTLRQAKEEIVFGKTATSHPWKVHYLEILYGFAAAAVDENWSSGVRACASE